MTVLAFLLTHLCLPEVVRQIGDCATTRGTAWSEQVACLGSMAFVGYLYLRAWLEIGRLFYTRWVRSEEFTARVGLPPVSEPESGIAIQREHVYLFLLACFFCVVIARCSELDVSRVLDRGPVVGLIVGSVGLVIVVLAAWYVRVVEPHLPFE